MLKYILFLLLISIIFPCCTSVKPPDSAAVPAITWSLPSDDLHTLPEADYTALTRLYDDHMLQNREVTLRDERLLTMRGINTLYTMPAYLTKAAWEKRKQYLREHILVCAGLWPMPEKNPLHSVRYHKVDHGDYSVETVTIETYPGFFLAGDVYLPKGQGPFPAVLTAHGHFSYGRLNNDSICSVPARCINLARQGYVVFAYDMVGYNDTRQVSHIFANDSIAGLYGINLLGLQLRNSIRALDYLLSLPYVDKQRIGITGASGGGTQTFLLTAVDDRFQAAAPVNMVSNEMQGGDLCENAPGLRINAFNAEIAAMIAPKPLLLVSDTHDWTDNTRNTIMPMLRSVYHLYHAEDKLDNAHFDYPHNYNKASREAVYAWFGKWLLHENDATKLREKPFTIDDDSLLLAFMYRRNADRNTTFEQLPVTEYHHMPDTLNEEGLKALLKDVYARQLNVYWPKDAKGLAAFRSVYGTAALHLAGAVMPQAADCRIMRRVKGKDFMATQLFISVSNKNEWIPCILYQPMGKAASTVILTADTGKRYWVDSDNAKPGGMVRTLLDKGCNVLTPDLFRQGEHVLQDSTMTKRDETVKYFTTYNLTDRQEQVQDLLTIIRCLRENDALPHRIDLYSAGNSGLTGLLLSAITDELDNTVLDGDHFDAATDQAMLTLGIPGIMRIGGLKTWLALAAGRHLMLFNADSSLYNSSIASVAALAGNKDHFLISGQPADQEKIINFLTQ